MLAEKMDGNDYYDYAFDLN